MPPARTERGMAIWGVLAAAALLRGIYLLEYRAGSVFWDSLLLDAEIYDAWARRIAAGDWLSGDAVYTLPPLYPWFLGLIYTIAGRTLPAVYVVQSLMGLANIYLIHSIGRKVFGGRTPIIAAIISVLYGSFMFMESKLMTTTLALTLGLALMRLLLVAGEKQTLTLWGCCGALLGVTALARPETLLFVPLAGWWIWRVTTRRQMRTKAAPIDQYALAGRQPWFAISVFVAFVIIAVSPATLRNWVVSNDWSLSNLISSQAGITFYQSNNPRARGLYVFLSSEGFSGKAETQAEEERKIAEKEAGRPLKRSEVTRYWMGRGLAWIASNPGQFLVLELRKLARFFGSYEYSTEYIIYVERETVRSLWLVSLPFSAIAAFALIGLLMQWKRGFPAPVILLALFVAANFLVVMMFYVSSRYRMPSAPYLILFAAHAVERILEGLTSGVASRRVEALVRMGAAVALFVPLHLYTWVFDLSHEIQEANTHYNAGNAWTARQLYDRAVAEYDRAVAGDPSNWRAWFNRGNALSALGRKPEAIDSFREVLKRNPGLTAARRRIEELGGVP